MKFTTVALASIFLCAVNATSIHKKPNEATINACLAGIEDAHAPATVFPKRFKLLFESTDAKQNNPLNDLLKTAKEAIIKVQGYSKSCDQLDNSYTAERSTRLLKSVASFINSLAETFKTSY